MQSRVVSKDEFNYDHLSARPLYSMVTQSDIDEVYRIATSVRLSGNPRKRYQLIDQVMHRRGFRKLSAGTNRVTYTYFEDPSIVVKVAADKTAILDNPREFVNQQKLKPFCTKVFEVDPSGTMGVFERVKPITSREEYMTVASDVFEMLDMITSKYVLADIGTKFFMNIGTRKNFGVVLLDFPYLYEINDPNSLVCKKPDSNSPGGFCGGLIDYDEGFNILRCNKCGAIYRAQELGSYLKTNKIIIKGAGKMSTKVKVSFVKDGKKVEIGNANQPDVMKEESPTIQHIEEKKPVEEKSDGILKVRVRGDKHNFSYDVDTKTPNQDATEYKFDTKRIRKIRPQVPAPNENRYKAPYARFSKVNERNNMVFTVKVNDRIHEILVDPSRIPEDVKKLFIPNFENLSSSTEELEGAKSDILALEEAKNILLEDNEKYKVEIEQLKSELAAAKKSLYDALNEKEEINERLDAIRTDRDNKLKYLDNIIRENESLKAQIRDLEEKVSSTANAINDSALAKMQELEEANEKLAEAEAEASDKVDKLVKELADATSGNQQIIDNLKDELVACQEENKSLKDMLLEYQQEDKESAKTESTNEYTVETNDAEEEYDDEEDDDEYEQEENTIFFINAVYTKLKDLVNYTHHNVELKYDDGTDVPEDIDVVAFRYNDGSFLVDNYNNMFVGINLSELQYPNEEEGESESETEE